VAGSPLIDRAASSLVVLSHVRCHLAGARSALRESTVRGSKVVLST
jgi:hypothetical protein